MGRLLLNSRGLNTKTGCLQISEKLKGMTLNDKKMFIVSYTPYGVDERIVENCIEILGFRRENLFLSVYGIPKNVIPDFIYVTEGNTFEILKYMQDNQFIDYIRVLMKNSETTYIGSSAGAIIAGTDIMLARDDNYIGMRNYSALHLFEGTILPHCEPEQLKEYIDNSDGYFMKHYSRILSVSNTDVLDMMAEN